MHDDIQTILLSEAEIQDGIQSVADEVTDAFRGREFTAVSILKGSCIFASDLIRRIPIPLDLAFVSARSYRGSTEPGRLDIRLMPDEDDVRGKAILLIDDILDSGRTLSVVTPRLLDLGAESVKTCVFLDKPARRTVEFEADFRCFEIADEFVVGYGLDFAGRYRTLPFLGVPRPEVLAAAIRAE